MYRSLGRLLKLSPLILLATSSANSQTTTIERTRSIQIVALYEGSGAGTEKNAMINVSSEYPIDLYLSAYKSVNWFVTGESHKVRRIFLTGYESQKVYKVDDKGVNFTPQGVIYSTYREHNRLLVDNLGSVYNLDGTPNAMHLRAQLSLLAKLPVSLYVSRYESKAQINVGDRIRRDLEGEAQDVRERTLGAYWAIDYLESAAERLNGSDGTIWTSIYPSPFIVDERFDKRMTLAQIQSLIEALKGYMQFLNIPNRGVAISPVINDQSRRCQNDPTRICPAGHRYHTGGPFLILR